MSIFNTKYTTLCIDENTNIILEKINDINLNELSMYIDCLKNRKKQLVIPIGANLEIDLTFNMVIVKKGYKINDGYLVTSLGTNEFIIKIQANVNKITELLENLYHLLAHNH